MTCLHITRAVAGALLLAMPVASAWAAAPAPRDVPAKSVPVPGTVSPELQAVIAQPLRAGWDTPPTTPEGWAQLAAQTEASVGATTQPMAERLHVDIAPSTIDGVKVYVLTPRDVSLRNKNRLLVHVHGGCYVLNPHLAALPEAVQVAAASGIKTIAVDYRCRPRRISPPLWTTR